MANVEQAGADDVCFICLESASAGPLHSPCACPRKVHRHCLARWQLQCAGKDEEKHCRFCRHQLPSWKGAFGPQESVPCAAPVMSIHFNNTTYWLKVHSGEEGLARFKSDIRQLLGLADHMHFDITFECKVPGAADNNWMELRGLNAFDAAVYCAACTAAERRKAQRSRKQDTTNTTNTTTSSSCCGPEGGAEAATGSSQQLSTSRSSSRSSLGREDGVSRSSMASSSSSLARSTTTSRSSASAGDWSPRPYSNAGSDSWDSSSGSSSSHTGGHQSWQPGSGGQGGSIPTQGVNNVGGRTRWRHISKLWAAVSLQKRSTKSSSSNRAAASERSSSSAATSSCPRSGSGSSHRISTGSISSVDGASQVVAGDTPSSSYCTQEASQAQLSSLRFKPKQLLPSRLLKCFKTVVLS